MNAPPAIIAIDVIHPTCDPVRHAHRSISVNPSTTKISPMIRRSALPRESMLQVRGMELCYPLPGVGCQLPRRAIELPVTGESEINNWQLIMHYGVILAG